MYLDFSNIEATQCLAANRRALQRRNRHADLKASLRRAGNLVTRICGEKIGTSRRMDLRHFVVVRVALLPRASLEVCEDT